LDGLVDWLTEPTPQIPRPRIQGLSDLIFGLALSIGAIQFIGNIPAKPDALSFDLLEFGFSFLILINVWNRYTATTSVMPVEKPAIIRLNMVLLFLVAIEPFLFDVLFAPGGVSTPVGTEASVYYALDIGAMNLILAYFTHVLASEERNLIPRVLMRRYKLIRNLLLFSSAIFFLSDLPVFWTVIVAGAPLRILLWVLALPVVWVPRIIIERTW
jgi:uncharacterized membrane protein